MKKKINKIFSITSIVLLSLVGCSNINHNHDAIYHNDENSHWHECVVENCEEKFNEELHTWSDWKILKKPTCTSMGLEERECSICHRVDKRNINKVSHTYPTEYQKDENFHWSVCSVCNTTKESSKENHFYSNWVVIEEATNTKEGKKEGYCVCGLKKQESIPMIMVSTESIEIDTPDEIVNGGISLEVGSFDLSYTISPSDATDYENEEIIVSSSNEEVAVVSDGKVNLLKEGFAEISVTNGKKTAILPLVVTNNMVDGNIDTEYPLYSPDIVVTNETGYNTTTKTNVFFGEGGFYIVHQVDDKYISGMTHIESSLCFSDTECNRNNTLFMNFYPMEDNYGHVRFFGDISEATKYSELTGDNAIPCAIEGKVLGEKGAYEGYVIESFIPYDVLREYGYNDSMTSVRYLPLTYQFKNQNDADISSLLSDDSGFDTSLSYGYINTLGSKFENHLLTVFNKDGSFTSMNKAPLVNYTFDNGIIENKGTATVNGRVTTISSDNKAIQEIANPNVTYGIDANGNENGAILLSNKRSGGNHFTINGVDIGTGDFTISVKVNLLQLTDKTDRSNYLFGIGNLKDPEYGKFNVSYMLNKSMNLNQLAVGAHNLDNEDGKTTSWCGYIPQEEFAEIRLVKKDSVLTVYLKYDANTHGVRKEIIHLPSKDAIDYTSDCNLGFSSNIGSQNPGDYPAYYDDIYIYDYALPI